MTPVDDIGIAANFKKGDLKTFENIFNMLFPPIYVFAQSLLGKDNAVAEDITMESFSKLYRKREDFDGIPNIRAFLYVATRNACLDYLRHTNRQEILNREWVKTVEQESFIEIKQVEGEMFNAVKEAIGRLPKKCRQIIQMIYVEGLGTAEISSRLSISIPTVRSQKRHGINLLKSAFADKQMAAFLLLFFIGSQDVFSIAEHFYQRSILLFIQFFLFSKFLASFFARS